MIISSYEENFSLSEEELKDFSSNLFDEWIKKKSPAVIDDGIVYDHM